MKFERGRAYPQRPQHPAAVEVEAVILDYIPGGLYNDPHREHRGKPVVQAVGVRKFTLVDGIPLAEVEALDRVTLARQIVRTLIYSAGYVGERVRRLQVHLACLPGVERTIYCYPITPLDEASAEALDNLAKEEGWKNLAGSPEELSKVAADKGLSDKIVVVPPTPLTFNDLTDLARDNLREGVRKIVVDKEEFFLEFYNIAEPVNIRLHVLELFKGIGKKTLKSYREARSRKRFKSFKEIKDALRIDPVEALVDKIVEEIMGEARYYVFVEPQDPSSPYLGYLDRMRKSLSSRRRGV